MGIIWLPYIADEFEYHADAFKRIGYFNDFNEAINAFVNIGPKAVPYLVKMLDNPDWKIRIKVIRALEMIYTQESWQALKTFWSKHPEFPYPYPPDEELQKWIGPPRSI